MDRSARPMVRPDVAPGAGPAVRRRRVMEYARAVAIVAAMTVVASLARTLFLVPDVEMLFLLGVAIVASTSGRGPSLVGSLLSVAAFDFFFVPPPLTFDVDDGRYVLTFTMMLAVGVAISSLTLRIREQEEAAAQRERERVHLQEDARRASLRADAEELRSALLSSVSHDLRTPLAAITGAATTLRGDVDLDTATRRELLDAVCDEAERLERLVGNLLDMTRLDSGATQPRREWVPLVEIVGGALTRLERNLSSRDVTTSIPDGLPLLAVDPVLVEQLLFNVLENATRYTPQGSEIAISAVHEDGAILVDVADRGPGLSGEAKERVFERFRRGAQAGTGGVGLGLTIARAIAQAHGGSLTAADRPGGGAVFRLRIPVGSPPPGEDSSS